MCMPARGAAEERRGEARVNPPRAGTRRTFAGTPVNASFKLIPPLLVSTFGFNSGYVEDLYTQYLQDPDSVSASWREFFADYRPGPTFRGGDAPAVELRAVECRTCGLAVPRAPGQAGRARRASARRGSAGPGSPGAWRPRRPRPATAPKSPSPRSRCPRARRSRRSAAWPARSSRTWRPASRSPSRPASGRCR